MAKRPPKPEGRQAAPRFIADKSPSLSKAVEATRKLIEQPVEVENTEDFEKFVEYDDPAAVVRAANVENALETALTSKLVIREGERRNLFRSDGPLGSFSNKITMGYALQIFGPVTKLNLDVIRHVRNCFAHSKKHVNFKTEEVFDLCSFFQLPKIYVDKEPANELMPTQDAQNNSEARTTFINATMITEISLVRYYARFLKARIRAAGSTVSFDPETTWIKFDDSLP